MTPTDPEMDEFSKSIDDQLDEVSTVMLKYAGKGEMIHVAFCLL